LHSASVPYALAYLLFRSDQPVDARQSEPRCGRWAGDRVVIVGDYDSGKLYERVVADADGWTDISIAVREELKQDQWLPKAVREALAAPWNRT